MFKRLLVQIFAVGAEREEGVKVRTKRCNEKAVYVTVTNRDHCLMVLV